MRFGRDIGLAWARAASTSMRRPQPVPQQTRTVHFLLEGDPLRGLSPACRYRAFQFVPLLQELGFECRLWPARPNKYFSAGPRFQRVYARTPRLAMLHAHLQLWRQRRNRMADFHRLAGNGVVFLQRDLMAVADDRLESCLPLYNRRIVFDFDDALFALPPWLAAARDPAATAAMERKLASLCAMATVVLAANEHLASFARQHCNDVRIVPTGLCTEEFRPPTAPPGNPRPVIGWAGTSGNLFYLRRLGPALRTLAGRTDFVLRVICNPVPAAELAGLPERNLEFVPWQATGEVARIQQFDVGIMPLDDDAWSRGKAGFKLVQYMACGVPFVASPVGANESVGGPDGACGFYARSSDDWVSALTRLLADQAQRAKLGAAGRARAVQHFDRRRLVPTLVEALQSAAE
jgi:glycosyltransferase involved in cell wall biosynthesis